MGLGVVTFVGGVLSVGLRWVAGFGFLVICVGWWFLTGSFAVGFGCC